MAWVNWTFGALSLVGSVALLLIAVRRHKAGNPGPGAALTLSSLVLWLVAAVFVRLAVGDW